MRMMCLFLLTSRGVGSLLLLVPGCQGITDIIMESHKKGEFSPFINKKTNLTLQCLYTPNLKSNL